jgi:GST-like protein
MASPPVGRKRRKKKGRLLRARRAPRSAAKAIDLYYWPTPNAWKVSIMLEECRLPYNVIAVNISGGEQFERAFLKISPNNRIPAIVDPGGPGGRSISVFESGAILQYLGRKTGKFYPASERARVEVDQWLFWQMANLGPKAGEASHFRYYAAAERQEYATSRFVNELNRLYGVMNRRLKDRPFLAGKYSVADMACVGWVRLAERRGETFEEFPYLRRWLAAVLARSAVQRGIHIRVEEASKVNVNDPKVREILFSQRAR